MQEQALTGYCVLDLTLEHGWMCGKILADLGADVMKIEPPAGDPGRGRGPFYVDEAEVDTSLSWWAYNTNKRSLGVDLSRRQGRELMLGLVRQADFVIEAFPPGRLEAMGLGYEVLRAANPRLILTSITPFGQSGPYRDFKGPDLVCMAMGGLMHLTGETAGRPVRISLPQAALHAGVEAAVASLLAHHWRRHSGVGQHIDVSMQACVAWTLMAASGFVPCGVPPPSRSGPCYTWVGYPRRLNFPCLDGYVSMFLVGGYVGGRSMTVLTRLMQAEGMAPPFMLERDWFNWTLSALGAEAQADSERIDAAVMAYTRTKTKKELYEAALAHRILLAPVSNAAELCANAQLRARQFFVPVTHAELGATFEYPGALARFSRTPCLPPRRAPRVGEHSRQLLSELLDLDTATIAALEADGIIACHPDAAADARVATAAPRPSIPASSPMGASALPLAGLRVIDFTWVVAGPLTAKYLGDHGAEVIRVESWAHPDISRYAPPNMAGELGDNRSYFFATFNTSKYSVSLNLSRPEARELVRRLIATADVVLESFTPQVMQKWGLDYASLTQLKPDLIMLSTCVQGQTGPHAHYPGFGNLIAGLLGFYELTGWPDEAPCVVYGAYTDFIVPRFAAVAILAALEYRQRTGQGQYIDLAQSEVSLHFLAPALLDYTVNGRIMRRQGNRDAHMAPHGAYPCQGQDRWCVIAVATDAEWQRLCTVVGHPEWSCDPRFTTLADRVHHAEALDALLSDWTRTQSAPEVMNRLQGVGVAAGVVQDMHDLRQDPQLHQRGFWVALDHGEIGSVAVDGHQFRFSTLANQPRFARPGLGAHNAYVLGDILGLSAADIRRLAEAEIVY